MPPTIYPHARGHFGPYGGIFVAETLIPALTELLLAAIGGVIEKHMVEIGFLEPRQKTEFVATPGAKRASCPRYGELALVFQEGCATCLSCGFSKCS